MRLGRPQQSGLIPVSDTVPTELVQIPSRACVPAHLCIRNVDTAATVYIKSSSGKVSTKISSTDYGVGLQPGESYDWDGAPPRGVSLMALSTVAGSLVSVEANWNDLSEEAR